ncbi:DCD domain-containing protein [Drosera capensis]
MWMVDQLKLPFLDQRFILSVRPPIDPSTLLVSLSTSIHLTMVIAKGKGKADASKAKARKVTSPTNVQRPDAAHTLIKTITEIEIPQPVTTETSCEESVDVSGNNAGGGHLSEGMEEENDEAEEMLHGEEKKLNVEENDDADLVNSDGSGGALGMVLEKADKTLVGSGNALNTTVDGLIKEYINNVLYKEKVPSKSGETTDVIEPNTDASLLICDMKGEDVTQNSTNITGEAKGTALVQAGGVSRNKKVMRVKKIIKKKAVVQKLRMAPEGEAEPQLLDENEPDDESKDSSSSAKVSQEEKVEAGHVVSTLVPESDTKEENVTLHPTSNGEAKGTAALLVGEGSVNEKVSKPKNILKKKAIVWRRKVIPGNEGEAQPLDANKSKDEVKGSSPRAKVNKEEKSEARHSDVVSISKKAGTKKVQGPTEKGTEKGGDKSEKSGSDQPCAEVNVNEVQPVDAKENKKEKCEDGLENPGKRDITETDKTEVNANSAKGKDKAETSNKKLEAKAKNKGMIFMCSSKTKPDCYRYKVLGLPASKKDVVSKIYKGMRLFLFDVDLRLLYGIYKAAGPGGYSLEPKAFKSDFPSQVRFTVLEDCLPVAEEKFKKVIKDNYYARNKFGCELSSEQVKNLCKLFQAESKGKAKVKAIKPQKASGRNRVPPASSSRKRDRSRRRIEVEPGHHHVDRDKGYKRRAKDIDYERRARDNGYDRRERDNSYERPAWDIGFESRARDEGMHGMHHDWHPLPHERREAFHPVVAAPVPVPQLTQALPPLRGLQYVYGNTPRPDAYLRDVAYELRDYGPSVPLDAYRHDHSLPGLEARGFRDELELRGPYDAHREPRAYLRPVYHGTAAVQDPYDYPPAQHRPHVGRPDVYHEVDPLYRRY